MTPYRARGLANSGSSSTSTQRQKASDSALETVSMAIPEPGTGYALVNENRSDLTVGESYHSNSF